MKSFTLCSSLLVKLKKSDSKCHKSLLMKMSALRTEVRKIVLELLFWKNASKKPVRNEDLWHELIAASDRHVMHWHWVKGHDGHPENERADKLASDQADSVRP